MAIPASDGYLTVMTVKPGSPADAAGMRLGDKLVSLNDSTIVDVDAWSAIATSVRLGRPFPVVVRRDDRNIELSVELATAPLDYWRHAPGVILLVLRTAQLTALAAGVFVLWRRPRDRTALVAAWFLLTCGVFSITLPWRLATVWREIPVALGGPLFLPYASALAIGPILLTFVASFPHRVRYGRYLLTGTWMVTAAVLSLPVFNFTQLIYGSGELRAIGPGTRPLNVMTVVSLAASLAIFTTNYRSINEVNERRKLRAVLAGFVAAVLSGFPFVAYYWYAREADFSTSLFESPALALAAVGMLSLPLTMMHAVLRHRLFDISFILRQGLRYAFARRLLLSLLPALLAILLLDLVAHGQDTVHDILRKRGPLYGTAAVAAIAVALLRQRWLDALDKRFFREHRDGFALLRGVAEHVRRSRSLDGVGPRVVATIESAVHPEFAALLEYDRPASVFRTVAAVPAASAVPELSAESKLVALARVLEQPIDTSPDGDAVLQQLPDHELEFIERTGLDLLVPVVTPDAQLAGLVALGRKRSEMPYSSEERNMLATIAENVALLASRSAPASEIPTLEECPECGMCFDAATRTCARDSSLLSRRSLPRSLAGRYRLDQRLATGGMGTVYEALDMALERPVAVKVVREDLASEHGAVGRFVREARLAARLTHPHVVTIHDFGVIDERQPFLVMERLVGRTLREELEFSVDMTAAVALSIISGVCTAVDIAHRLQLVHCDLKPDNIFLVEGDAGPLPKILDFGVARPFIGRSGATTRQGSWPGVVIGTPAYMAPEQLRGEPPSPTWDLWSLGIIALELLSGSTETLPNAVSMGGVMAGRRPGRWDPASDLRSIWPTCATFFSQALALDPAFRPPDGRTFHRLLADALHADGALNESAARPS